MGLPQLESCCFITDLKTGNIILGCFNAVLSLYMTVMMIVVAFEVDELVPPQELEDIEAKAAATGLYAMSLILVVMFLAKFCFDLFFVYGVITERAGIIRAYFIMWVVFFLLSMFTFFLNAPHYGVGTIATMLFYIGIDVYTILLSHSFYKLLNNREIV